MPRLKQAETVTLEYMDADRIRTQRTVDLVEARTENGRTYLEAFCHARGEPRTFRSDRIDAIIDENGEVLDPAQFLHRLTSDPTRVWASGIEQAKAEGGKILTIDPSQNPNPPKRRTWTAGTFVKALAAICALALGLSLPHSETWERILYVAIAWAMIYLPVWLAVWIIRKAKHLWAGIQRTADHDAKRPRPSETNNHAKTAFKTKSPARRVGQRTIVFTGKLKITRAEAAHLAKTKGYEIGTHVSRKTDILVDGEIENPRRDSASKANKRQHAEGLFEQGHQIDILSESDFMKLMETDD